MGKVSAKEKSCKNSKQKRRNRGSKNKYLNPGALAQLCNTKTSVSKSCMDLGKKRVAVVDAEKGEFLEDKCADDNPIILSPARFRYGLMAGPVDLLKENNLQRTPKMPQPVEEAVAAYESGLESLPMELLVKILCHLHHDQLRAVFHVSERIRKAVVIARRLHFNYTTPDRSRQEMLNTMTPLPTEYWPFVSMEDEKSKVITLPRTPKAPRHGPRPPSRIKLIEMRQVAAVLFQESGYSPRRIVQSVLPKHRCKSFQSHRVLFFEEELELCQAVAENKLR